jgi:cytoskeletal protein CcmA (bactofilin family)
MITHRKHVQFALAASLALLLTVALAGRAAAVEIRGGDETVTIAKDEVIDDDLLVAGRTVVVDGTVNGDLIAAAGTVTINGQVNGSVIMAAQSLTLNGTVDGSVYAGGEALSIGPNATVGRNLYFGGYSLVTENGSSVGRDALLGVYQAILRGAVKRDVKLGGAALEIYGSVGGDVTADVGSPGDSVGPGPMFFMPGAPAAVAPGLRIGPDAEVGGELKYTSTVEQAEAIEATPQGGVIYQTPEPNRRPSPARTPRVGFTFDILGWMLGLAREFITLLIVGALVVWRLPTWIGAAMEKARAQILPSAGWGLLVIIVGYVGAVIIGILVFCVGFVLFFVTLGGLSGMVFGVGFSGLGLAFAVFSFLVEYGSKVVVAYLIGYVIVQRVLPRYLENRFVLMGAGVVVYMIIRAVPLVGWLAGIVATLIGVGAMWLLFSEWRAGRAGAAPAAPMMPAAT